MTLRDEILDFAYAMEDKMASHDGERGDEWKGMTLHELNERLGEELAELKDAPSKKHIKRKLVDVANLCMMLYHKLNDGGDQQ